MREPQPQERAGVRGNLARGEAESTAKRSFWSCAQLMQVDRPSTYLLLTRVDRHLLSVH